jgi:hypothetical protein
VLQVNKGGVWTNVQNSCPNGQPAGTCGTATNPTSFTFGTQGVDNYGASVATGAAAGSVQSIRMCGANNNCTAPFNLSIPTCPIFYISPGNNPLGITQGGEAMANLLMYGPWISADKGVNAKAVVANNPNSDVTFSFSPGETSAYDGRSWIGLTAYASNSAAVGPYTVSVQGTDLASGVSVITKFQVEVHACTTTPVSQVCTSNTCGQLSIGCGQTTDCGTCATGTCSAGLCCPTGTWNQGGVCASNTPPPTCPSTKPYCDTLGACATPLACKNASCSGGVNTCY